MGLFAILTRILPRGGRRRRFARLDAAPLAPCRLERRRVLDASGVALLLGPLVDPGDAVQAGELHDATPPAGANNDSVSSTAVRPADVTLTLSSDNLLENEVVQLTVDNNDPVEQQFVSVEIDWGDGTSPEVIDLSSSGLTFDLAHRYLDDNPTATPVDVNPIQLLFTNIDGNLFSAETAITVNNVAPEIDTIAITSPIDEDGTTTLIVTFTDPGIQDTFELDIDWDGDNVFDETVSLSGSAFVVKHQFLDDDPTGTSSDTFDVNVRLRDDDLGEDTGSVSITVNNVAPTIDTLSITSPIDENGTAMLTGTFSDPGTLDTFELDIDWDGDSVFDETVAVTGGAFSVSHQFLDDNPTGTSSDTFDVNVRLRDDDLGEDTGSVSITVNNVAPTIDTLSISSPIDENGTAMLMGTFSDPGTLDTFELDIDWDGDSVFDETVAVTGGAFSVSHQFLDDDPTATSSDTFDVNVRLRDDDLGEDTGSVSLTVNNVAPTIDTLSITSPIDENVTATLTGTFSDPGTLDTFELDIDWDGDNVFDETVAVTGGAFSVSHQFLDDDPTGTSSDTFDVNVRLRDDDLGEDTDSVSITVNNVAPTIDTLSITSPIDENGTAMLTGTFSDPGTLDTFELDIDWDGDTVFDETVAVTGGAFSVSHQFLDDDPTGTSSDTFDVNVRLRDDDLGEDTGSVSLTVNNVAPDLVLPANILIDEGALLDLTGGGLGSFTDVGTLDTHTATVSWGDGTATEAAAVNQFDGSGTLGASHTYADNGLYTVTITVTDDDGGVDVDTFMVEVNNVAPVLTVVGDQTVDEGALLAITDLGTFFDPGFDNPLNTLDPGNGGQVEERFFSKIDWGDGTLTNITSATIDQPGGPGQPTAGSFDGAHIYADNGTYTVTVELTDDDGGFDTKSFLVVVSNVDPILVGDDAISSVDEGAAITLDGLGITLADPGFDNPFNPLQQPGGSQETFVGDSIDWGDGTAADPLTIFDRQNGGPNQLTTAKFSHAPHHYADNGTYTVTVRMSDDDGGVVARTFEIVVDNVAPSLTLTSRSLDMLTISEGMTLDLFDLATFSDPGFNNAANPNGASVESFTYTINWGDGAVETGQLPATVVDGGSGVLTLGTLVNSHLYTDNDVDNLYTVTVTLMDDDGGTATESITVRVLNVNPTLEPIISATDVNTKGETFLTIEFADPGTETLTVWVDWGDIRDPNDLSQPGPEPFVIDIPTMPDSPIEGPGTFVATLMHTYAGPPNPQSPASDINIFVIIVDDDFDLDVAGQVDGPLAGQPTVDPGRSVTRMVAISNPGEGTEPVRIDTTPQVPQLVFPPRMESDLFFEPSTPAETTRPGGDLRAATGEVNVTTERFLELRVIDSAGNQSEGYRLKSEVLKNLPALFQTLPDNHYAIYLVRLETNTRRLVIEVFVRNGKLIDPGDDSEGTRDRPPTDQSSPDEQLPPAGDEVENDSATIEDRTTPVKTPADGELGELAVPLSEQVRFERLGNRHAQRELAIAAIACAASNSRVSWAQQVDQALATAQPRQWSRLRWRNPRRLNIR